MNRRKGTRPGDGLLHPVAVAALAVLLTNDHWLKATAPGLLTGKISDVAGLIVFPLLLVAAGEVIAAARRAPVLAGNRTLVVAVAATAGGFAAVKLLGPAALGFGVALGAAQWLVSAPLGLLEHGTPGALHLAESRLDPGDLIALPAVLVAWWAGRHRGSSPSGQPRWRPAGSMAGLGSRLRTAAICAALVATALATVATEPSTTPPPASLTQSFDTRFDFTASAPVAIRDLTITVGSPSSDQSTTTEVDLQMNQPGLRVIVAGQDGTLIPDWKATTPEIHGQTTDTIARLVPGETTTKVHLMVELTDLSLAPLSVPAVVLASTTLGTTVLPTGVAVQIAGLDGGSLPVAATTEARRGGSLNLDAGHPIAFERLTVQIHAGAVAERPALVLDEALSVHLADPTSSVIVAASSDLPYQGGQGRAVSYALHGADFNATLPDHEQCTVAAGCTFTYLVSFSYTGNVTGHASFVWAFREALVEFGVAQAPKDRTIAVAQDAWTTPGSSTAAPTYTLGGRTIYGAGVQQAINDISALYAAGLPPASPGTCAIVGTVTLAIPSDPSQSGPPVRVSVGQPGGGRPGLELSRNGDGGTVVFSGQSACFRDLSSSYPLMIGVSTPVLGQPNPAQVEVDWTVQIQLMAPAGGPPPDGATLTLRPFPEPYTSFGPAS